MSDLTFLEKRKFEQLLGMGTGYVLDFSNRSFAEFASLTYTETFKSKPYEGRRGNENLARFSPVSRDSYRHRLLFLDLIPILGIVAAEKDSYNQQRQRRQETGLRANRAAGEPRRTV